MSMSRADAESEAKSGAEALGRLGVVATHGVEYVHSPNGSGNWRSRVHINGRTAGQLALEVIAARSTQENS
jgi:hypothetical protein